MESGPRGDAKHAFRNRFVQWRVTDEKREPVRASADLPFQQMPTRESRSMQKSLTSSCASPRLAQTLTFRGPLGSTPPVHVPRLPPGISQNQRIPQPEPNESTSRHPFKVADALVRDHDHQTRTPTRSCTRKVNSEENTPTRLTPEAQLLPPPP